MARNTTLTKMASNTRAKPLRSVVVTSTMTKNDGQPVTNRFAQIEPNVWAYFGADGYAVTGEQVINGQHLYFDQSGRQVKGAYVTVNGQRRYYDANTGEYVPGR